MTDRPTLLECWCGRCTLEPSLRAALRLAIAHEHDEPRQLHANPPRPSRRPRARQTRRRGLVLSWEQWQAVYAARAAATRDLGQTYVSRPLQVAAR